MCTKMHAPFFLGKGRNKSDSCFLIRPNCWSILIQLSVPKSLTAVLFFTPFALSFSTCADRIVGSDLESCTKPPLRGGKRTFSALVMTIGNVIISKIIFVRQGACTWIPRTTVSFAPVRIRMHMLGISLHKHP